MPQQDFDLLFAADGLGSPAKRVIFLSIKDVSDKLGIRLELVAKEQKVIVRHVFVA